MAKQRDSLLIRFHTVEGQELLAEWWEKVKKEHPQGGVNPVAESMFINAMKASLENKAASDTLLAKKTAAQTEEIINRLSKLTKLQLRDLAYSLLTELTPINQKLNLLLNLQQQQMNLPIKAIQSPDKAMVDQLDFEFKTRAMINNKKRQK